MKPQRTLWIAAAVATATVAGVLTVQGLGDDSTTGKGDGADTAAGPVTTEVHQAELKRAADGRTAALGRRDTDPFSMLGITWTDPDARLNGTIEVRTRSAASGEWTPWVDVDTEAEARNEAGARVGLRGASEPRWVGASNGVEVRMTAGGTTRTGLPEGLRLDMIDPGEGPGEGKSTTTRAAGNGSASIATDIEPAAFALTGEDLGLTGEDLGQVPGADPSTPAPEGSSVTTVPQNPAPTPTEQPGQPPATSEAPAPSTPAAPSEEPAPGTSTPGATPGTTPPTTPSAPSSSAPVAQPPSSPPSSSAPSTPPAPPSSAPKPPITSRGAWGADEGLSTEGPEYNPDVKAVFVHHTAQTSTYACTDSPKIMRGLHTYHVRTVGWKDLGYNFAVDRCGTVFEGRKGGVDLPVLGAHTFGFNRESAGIAVIGDWDKQAAPSAAVASVARIAAWKLGQYKADPTGTVKLKAGANGGNHRGTKFTSGQSYAFPRVSGHRDGFNTVCPGGQLYAQLPTVRSYAGGAVSGLTVKSVTGAGLSGSTYYAKGAVTVGWSASTPSSFVRRYELLVDGKVVATTAATATSAKATLAPGTRTVQVRATHISGRTTTSATATIVVDTAAPSFSTKPALTLRGGTVNTAAVPLTLSWKATDKAALKEVRLTAPTAKTYGPTTTSAGHTAQSGKTAKWSMTAYDRAGNTAAASVSGTAVILQESSAKKSGAWSSKSSSSYLGGKSLASSAKNASLTWTFTGRSAALVVSRAATSGQLDVYVDGRLAKTVDLKSSSTKYRDALWTRSWSSSAPHTVKIVVKGTKGRPAVTTDGLVYLK
ncbi:N-acetylmuramoyl-L-alanine amidase [Streptomyces sp. NPDC005955]|uniref:N-acetylmuramoyl-L-alanine amidase n=1 Tax=Streptomyces sp. NPDC005955 TaxID=3364738 RepID=UPI003687410F